MKRLLVLLVAVPSAGCSYAGDRIRDFGDMFRIELGAGVGLQADAAAGELVHAGVGSSRRWMGGLRYGEFDGEKRVEDHFPLSYIWTIAAPDTESLHSLRWGDEARSQHRCYMIFPGELRRGTHEKDPIHYFDVEAGVFAGIIGAQVGFSIGEFVDWLVGFTTLDIARDDGVYRQSKSYWRPITDPKEFDRP